MKKNLKYTTEKSAAKMVVAVVVKTNILKGILKSSKIY